MTSEFKWDEGPLDTGSRSAIQPSRKGIRNRPKLRVPDGDVRKAEFRAVASKRPSSGRWSPKGRVQGDGVRKAELRRWRLKLPILDGGAELRAVASKLRVPGGGVRKAEFRVVASERPSSGRWSPKGRVQGGGARKAEFRAVASERPSSEFREVASVRPSSGR